MLPLLRCCRAKQLKMSELCETMAQYFHLSEKDRQQLLPSGKALKYKNNIGWAARSLVWAGLLASPKRAVYTLTPEGEKVLNNPPTRFTETFLKQYPGFLEAKYKKHQSDSEILADEAVPQRVPYENELSDIVADYKAIFKTRWQTESFKWRAVKHFAEHWDIDADDFYTMFMESTAQAKTLLTAGNLFARSMMGEFIKMDKEAVRGWFRRLYDEEQPLALRVETFLKAVEDFRKAHNPGSWSRSFHEKRIASIYLWFRYPDKYFIYGSSYVQRIALALGVERKRDASAEALVSGEQLLAEIASVLQQDTELVAMLQAHLDDECAPDSKLRTLTSDLSFWFGRDKNRQSVMPMRVDEENDTEEEDITSAAEEQTETLLRYTREDYLREVFSDSETYEQLSGLLRFRRNVILQGAPGVGKTYAAKRLAYAMMGVRDDSRVMMVQFHESYSYAQFVQGIRPDKAGFVLRSGPFVEFCRRAALDGNRDYFLLIDEINRGETSKIFGELFMLVENEHRGESLLLADGQPFCVPKNLFIIGMMNTADRRIAFIDYALRRRFAFYDMCPALSHPQLEEMLSARADSEVWLRLLNTVQALNLDIAEDSSLGSGFCIGHSYFCTDAPVSLVVRYMLLPMLREYWFDAEEKYKSWETRLLEVIS